MNDDDRDTTPLSPTEALRILDAILSDARMGRGGRHATAYVVLRADHKTRLAWASYRGIRERYGVRLDAIADALRAAPDAARSKAAGKAIGVYLDVHERGRHGSVCYVVLPLRERCQPPALPKTGSSAPENGRQRSRGGRHSYPITAPHALAPPGDGDCAQTVGADGRAVADTLTAAGVRSARVVRELAGLPGITPAVVALAAREAGGKAGVLVEMLRDDRQRQAIIDREAADRLARQRRTATDTEARAARQEAREQSERERIATNAIVEGLSPDALSTAVDRAMAGATDYQRRTWAHRDVGRSRTLRIAVADIVRADRAHEGAAAGGAR